MSSLAWNIKRKMEWMGRRIRKIDDAAELKNWASALRELNTVLKELDIKEYKDNWRPWSQRNKQGKKGGWRDQVESHEPYLLRRKMVTVPQVGLEESSGADLMNIGERKWSRPPRVEVDGDDVEMLGPKAAVMKMLKDAKELQENTQQEMTRPLETETDGAVADNEDAQGNTQEVEVKGDEVVPSGTLGDSVNEMEIEANENKELNERNEKNSVCSAENAKLIGRFDIKSKETRDLLRKGLNQRLQADGMVDKVDGKLIGFPDGTYTQARFWKIVKALEKDLGLQKRFLVTKSEVRRQLQNELYLGYGLKRMG